MVWEVYFCLFPNYIMKSPAIKDPEITLLLLTIQSPRKGFSTMIIARGEVRVILQIKEE